MGSVVCCCISLLLHIAFPLCPIRGIMDWACSILHSRGRGEGIVYSQEVNTGCGEGSGWYSFPLLPRISHPTSKPNSQVQSITFHRPPAECIGWMGIIPYGYGEGMCQVSGVSASGVSVVAAGRGGPIIPLSHLFLFPLNKHDDGGECCCILGVYGTVTLPIHCPPGTLLSDRL